MQPIEMKIYVYADSIEEVEQCKNAIHNFISDQRQQGRAVTAKKITEALTRFGNNPLLNIFLQ